MSSSSLLLSSPELSDTKVCEPQIRARLGTAEMSTEIDVIPLKRNPGLNHFPGSEGGARERGGGGGVPLGSGRACLASPAPSNPLPPL